MVFTGLSFFCLFKVSFPPHNLACQAWGCVLSLVLIAAEV